MFRFIGVKDFWMASESQHKTRMNVRSTISIPRIVIIKKTYPNQLRNHPLKWAYFLTLYGSKSTAVHIVIHTMSIKKIESRKYEKSICSWLLITDKTITKAYFRYSSKLFIFQFSNNRHNLTQEFLKFLYLLYPSTVCIL